MVILCQALGQIFLEPSHNLIDSNGRRGSNTLTDKDALKAAFHTKKQLFFLCIGSMHG
jgi:hypothetical protein